MIDADPAHATFKGAFPADDIYRVGQCASGWIPFLARGSVTRSSTPTVWVMGLSGTPITSMASQRSAPSDTHAAEVHSADEGNVHQCAFCTPEGTTGRTSAGTPMVCKSKHGDQPRWVRP